MTCDFEAGELLVKHIKICGLLNMKMIGVKQV